MGILRSLGALARALGPVVSSSGKGRLRVAFVEYLNEHFHHKKVRFKCELFMYFY